MNVSEVMPQVWMLHFGLVQAYVCEEAGRLTLIDTGLAGQHASVLDALRGLGRKPDDLRQIVLTHGHQDHTGSASALAERTGARVLAHRLDAPFIRGAEDMPPANLTDAERPYAEAIVSQVPAAPPANVDRELEDGDAIDLFGESVIVGMPGHTPGSIAVHAPARRLLFTGDALATFEGRLILGPFNIDRERAIRSAIAVSALDFDVAFFGHGDPILAEASRRSRRLAGRLDQELA